MQWYAWVCSHFHSWSDCVQLFATLYVSYSLTGLVLQSCPSLQPHGLTIAHQAPLSMGLFSQDYWSGLPFPPPGDLPDPGIEPRSPASPARAGRFFAHWATWEAPEGAPLYNSCKGDLWSTSFPLSSTGPRTKQLPHQPTSVPWSQRCLCLGNGIHSAFMPFK